MEKPTRGLPGKRPRTKPVRTVAKNCREKLEGKIWQVCRKRCRLCSLLCRSTQQLAPILCPPRWHDRYGRLYRVPQISHTPDAAQYTCAFSRDGAWTKVSYVQSSTHRHQPIGPVANPYVRLGLGSGWESVWVCRVERR